MDNVRIYLLPAGQHGPAAFPPAQTIGQQRNNPLDYRWAMKALLVAMDRWTATGALPPPSRYPRIADGTLVPPDQLRFPKLPGVDTSTAVHLAYRADYGPRFASEGVVTVEPPRIGTSVPDPRAAGRRRRQRPGRDPHARVDRAARHLHRLESFQRRDQGRPTRSRACRGPTFRWREPPPIASARTIRARRSTSAIATRIDYVGLVTKGRDAVDRPGLLLADDLASIVRDAARHWDYAESARRRPPSGKINTSTPALSCWRRPFCVIVRRQP